MAKKLPKKVKDNVCLVWPQDKAHAAKQIVCWLDDKVFRHDLDAQVNYAISIGMAAERLSNASANAFIAEVEVVLKGA